MNFLFPSYFTHVNEVSDKYAESMFMIKEKTDEFCSGVKFKSLTDSYNYNIYDQGFFEFFKPNSIGKKSLDVTESYWLYFQRRCFFHVYADAVKATVAINAYKNTHNNVLPEKLDVLVPDYLDKLPIDYFTGETLRYSPEKQWLYSVGADYKDDGGAVEGFYRGRCREQEEPCFNNPTVPLAAPPLPTE